MNLKHILLATAIVGCSLITSANATDYPSNCPTIPEFETCFTPGEDCQHQVIKVINTAKSMIRMQAYTLTDEAIADALIRANDRGVIVFILLDKRQKTDPHSQYKRLKKAENKDGYKIEIKFDKSPAIAHNKVIIVDNVLTLTGSYNFTKSAQERNAENVLTIIDRKLAEKYTKAWKDREAKSSLDGEAKKEKAKEVIITDFRQLNDLYK